MLVYNELADSIPANTNRPGSPRICTPTPECHTNHYTAANMPIDIMQCQQCEKPATFHITELSGEEHQQQLLKELMRHQLDPENKSSSLSYNIVEEIEIEIVRRAI